jgi:hypothetical protein
MNSKLLRLRISSLDDADERSIPAPHNTSQLTGIFHVRRKDSGFCVFRKTLVKELTIVLFGGKRVVSIAYEDILCRNVFHATLDGMAATMLFRLNGVRELVSKCCIECLIGSRRNDNRVCIDALESVDDIPQHRVAQDIMENLWYRTFHARAESSGEDQSLDGRS